MSEYRVIPDWTRIIVETLMDPRAAQPAAGTWR